MADGGHVVWGGEKLRTGRDKGGRAQPEEMSSGTGSDVIQYGGRRSRGLGWGNRGPVGKPRAQTKKPLEVK